MKQSIYLNDFRKAFADANRDNNFSYEGKEVLFDYLESYEADTGEEIELDIIALCCEFSEYRPLRIADSYGYDLEHMEELDTDEERLNYVVDKLNENTCVCGITEQGTIVYQDY
jgi:hypothetical protein